MLTTENLRRDVVAKKVSSMRIRITRKLVDTILKDQTAKEYVEDKILIALKK